MNGFDLTDLPLWFILPFLFLVGTVIGSFLNVCIYRIPQHERLRDQLRSLSYPPSNCPICNEKIWRSDNIPVIGWFKLRGRCRFCRTPFSFRYPAIELLNGLLFVLVYWLEMPENVRRSITDSCVYAHNGPQMFAVMKAASWLHLRYAYHMVLIEVLVVATFIDLDEMIIPDGVTVPAMIVGVLGSLSGQVFLVPVWFQNSRDLHIWKSTAPDWLIPFLGGADVPAWIHAHPHLHGLAVSLAGLVIGGGVVWIVRIIAGWVLKREAMGFGDVTLMAAVGSFIGWQPALLVFFVAPFCAILGALFALFIRRSQTIPYGPYLSLGTIVTLLAWEALWLRAEKFFQLGVLVVVFGIMVPLLLAVCLMIVQAGKWVLGVPLYVDEQFETEQWQSSDQLAYLSGENTDDRQGNWKTDRWSGTDAGRGTIAERQWREGPG